jgi:hypothetical protein
MSKKPKPQPVADQMAQAIQALAYAITKATAAEQGPDIPPKPIGFTADIRRYTAPPGAW